MLAQVDRRELDAASGLTDHVDDAGDGGSEVTPARGWQVRPGFDERQGACGIERGTAFGGFQVGIEVYIEGSIVHLVISGQLRKFGTSIHSNCKLIG